MMGKIALWVAALWLITTPAVAVEEPLPVGSYQQVKNEHPMATDHVYIQEFFWYSCPHCYELEAPTRAWLKRFHDKSIIFERIPPALNPYWKQMSELYYALASLGKLESMHLKIFKALQEDQINLYDRAVLKKFLLHANISWSSFQKALASFEVHTKVLSSAALANSYGIEGVPVFIVQGKYLTSTILAGNQADLFTTLHTLVELVKKENTCMRGQLPAGRSSSVPAPPPG